MTEAADRDLAADQFQDLNKRFYRARPYSYLRQRLNALLLTISDSDHVAAALRDGISYGEVGMQNATIRASDEHADDYAAMESVVLFHHAAEAMFRLFLCHDGMPPCPWLEVSRWTPSREFKSKVEELIESTEQTSTKARLLSVFRGYTDYSEEKIPCTREEWDRYADGLMLLLAHVGRILLNDGPLYNSVKHGLGVLSEDAGVAVTADGKRIIAAQGPSLSFLEVVKRSGDGRRVWQRTTNWIRPDSAIALTVLVTNEIQSLWNVARSRYLGEDGAKVAMTTPEKVRVAMNPDDRDTFGESVSVELRYYRRHQGVI